MRSKSGPTTAKSSIWRKYKASYARSHSKYVNTAKGRAAKRRAQRKYKQTVKGKQAAGRYNKKAFIKIIARRKVNNAVRFGRLVRLPCIHCGSKKTEGHHSNYRKPLTVTWLCSCCHIKLHIRKEKK